MPELPEVETVRRGLAPVMEQAQFTAVRLFRENLRYPFPPDFSNLLKGRRVRALIRHGKYLIAQLDGDDSLIMHLGMSGSFRIVRPRLENVPGAFVHARSKDESHDHVRFDLAGPDGPVAIIYNDPRRFGFMDLCTGHYRASRHIRNLGTEPLSNAFSPAMLARQFAARHTSLKSALLDQRLIAGIGNIYACEALWQARLSPRRMASSLAVKSAAPGARCARLHDAIRNVLNRAIAAGGSSLRDYRRTDGELGYFQHSFNVYGRTGMPCRAPGCTGTIVRYVQAGRSTFACPACQR